MIGRVAGGIVAGLILGLTGCLAVVALAFGGGLDAACTPLPGAGPGKPVGRFDAEQVTNAAAIARVGQQLSVPPRGQVIAVATAIQESSLRNIDHGDNTGPDSRGLFQQRAAWGSLTERMNPASAARLFYTGGRGGQPGLLDIPGWTRMPLTQAAQAVQNSAHPDRYARWEDDATALVDTITRTPSPSTLGVPGKSDNSGIPGTSQPTSPTTPPPATPGTGTGTNGTPRPGCSLDAGINPGSDGTDIALPPGYRPPPGTPATVITAISWALSQRGTPYSYGGDCRAPHSGNPAQQCDCSSLTQAAYRAAGVTLPRTTTGQVHAGTAVVGSAFLRAGDLIFIPGSLGTRTNPRHVGLYLGDGMILNAPRTGDVVKVIPLSAWVDDIVQVRRVVKDD
jgi:cell wall-associated NlpC family hydrolase